MNKPTLLEYFEQKSRTLLAEFELSKQQEASSNLGRNRENFVKIGRASCRERVSIDV